MSFPDSCIWAGTVRSPLPQLGSRRGPRSKVTIFTARFGQSRVKVRGNRRCTSRHSRLAPPGQHGAVLVRSRTPVRCGRESSLPSHALAWRCGDGRVRSAAAYTYTGCTCSRSTISDGHLSVADPDRETLSDRKRSRQRWRFVAERTGENSPTPTVCGSTNCGTRSGCRHRESGHHGHPDPSGREPEAAGDRGCRDYRPRPVAGPSRRHCLPDYLLAARTGDGGAPVGAVAAPGSGMCGTPGVPIWPASHGSDDANVAIANGQSCLPGVATTAQLMPSVFPSAQSELAAWVWSPGLPPASRPPNPTALLLAFELWYCVWGLLEIANHPAAPVYGPCFSMTVVGSKASYAATLPWNSRWMVCSLVPATGARSPATSTKALNRSGCITVKSTAQVPPIDQPTTPQLAAPELVPNVELTYGTTSLVR